MTKVSPLVAIKKFMERDDKHSPGGGRKVETKEFVGIPKGEKDELGKLAAMELGPEFELEISG